MTRPKKATRMDEASAEMRHECGVDRPTEGPWGWLKQGTRAGVASSHVQLLEEKKSDFKATYDKYRKLEEGIDAVVQAVIILQADSDVQPT